MIRLREYDEFFLMKVKSRGYGAAYSVTLCFYRTGTYVLWIAIEILVPEFEYGT